jgi:hypothetical protein
MKCDLPFEQKDSCPSPVHSYIAAKLVWLNLKSAQVALLLRSLQLLGTAFTIKSTPHPTLHELGLYGLRELAPATTLLLFPHLTSWTAFFLMSLFWS